MKPRALAAFRRKLAAGEPVVGLWVTLESPSITEIAVALGLDWVVVDAEHGHLDWKEIVEHVRAAVRSDTVVLVRLVERDTGLTKRALDIGADGVVLPWIETAAELREAIRDARYPPEGRRGIGGERATAWGACLVEHAAEANEQVLVVPIIERVAAVAAIPEMIAVEGSEVFFFGPADFSASAGHRGQWEGPGVAEQILAVKDKLRAGGKYCGVLTTGPDDLRRRVDNGFQMVGLGGDAALLMRSLRERLAVLDRDRTPAPSLDPRDGREAHAPLARPAESFRPDRTESMNAPGERELAVLQEGVTFDGLVGAMNGARNLTTGIVTFAPGASLDLHTHPASESITVLEGTAEVSVEGRTYRLGPRDNIVIPRWLPHAACNPDAKRPARLHVALAMAPVERTLVDKTFTPRAMRDDAEGLPGAERVTRIATAARTTHVGLGTEFVDYFNAEQMPGLEMSGGWGRFVPGGRLPAHLHDFDESISIIDGAAVCRVEGREYALAGGATALVPRGRVHYFVNDSNATMEMIWVYAGPHPKRIVVDEACATREGAPWK
jgi:2-keto-3-deoxy-L-rhamnonate aldolase RhmA/quercetin dioxygenase-like cupin family protein